MNKTCKFGCYESLTDPHTQTPNLETTHNANSKFYQNHKISPKKILNITNFVGSRFYNHMRSSVHAENSAENNHTEKNGQKRPMSSSQSVPNLKMQSVSQYLKSKPGKLLFFEKTTNFDLRGAAAPQGPGNWGEIEKNRGQKNRENAEAAG